VKVGWEHRLFYEYLEGVFFTALSSAPANRAHESKARWIPLIAGVVSSLRTLERTIAMQWLTL